MSVPEKRLWVIGDIHGMYDPLKRLIDCIRHIEYIRKSDDDTKATLIFIGDYIDYGPSSKEVVDLLLEVRKEFPCVFLCGNHEDMMLQFLHHSDLFDRYGNMWFRNAGGQNTIVSFMPAPEIYRRIYGTSDDHARFTRDEVILDARYHDFFEALVYSHTETLNVEEQTIKFAFTHASLLGPQKEEQKFSLREVDVSVSEQLNIKTYDDFHAFRTEKKIWIEDLHLWNRSLPAEKFEDYILIHGHTPTPLYHMKYQESGAFKPDSALPFVKFIDDKAEARKSYRRLSFSNSLEQVISINIDTGAAYGKTLTALYITERDLLYDHHLEVFQTEVGCSRLESDITSVEFQFD